MNAGVFHMVVPDLREGYHDVVGAVLEHGEPVAPRGQKTLEVTGATIVVEDPTDALPIAVGRRINPAIAAAEAVQLVGGFSDPAMMASISKNFTRFMDLGSFHGAYGPRLKTQLGSVIERLRNDPDSRQAVVTIWDPMLDSRDGPKDLPCTITLQFLLRPAGLELHTYMRSNDVWLGLAYDAFQFTQLQLTVCNVLGEEPGRYVHRVGSFHLYLSNEDAANDMLDGRGGVTETELAFADRPRPDGFGARGMDWWNAQNHARNVYAGARALSDGEVGYSGAECWYADLLAPHVPQP